MISGCLLSEMYLFLYLVFKWQNVSLQKSSEDNNQSGYKGSEQEQWPQAASFAHRSTVFHANNRHQACVQTHPYIHSDITPVHSWPQTSPFINSTKFSLNTRMRSYFTVFSHLCDCQVFWRSRGIFLKHAISSLICVYCQENYNNQVWFHYWQWKSIDIYFV